MSRPLAVHSVPLAAALALLAACTPRSAVVPTVQSESAPPAVYLAKTIHTLDPARPAAQAMGMRAGRIAAMGTREQVLAAMGASAKVHDLGDSTIVPGFTDSHGHLGALGRSLTITHVQGARSAEEAAGKLTSAKPASFQGDWLLGDGWDQNEWAGRAFPTRTQLDAKLPGVPVVLNRVDYHALWLSTEALRRAGITRATKDPEGGRILRDAQGEPTGVLIDTAMSLVEKALPPPTRAQLEERLTAALQRCKEAGLTGMHDAGMDLATFQLLQSWDMTGRLPMRIYAMADGQGADAEAFLDHGTFQGRMLTLRAVKLVLDGALGSRGAALHAPYTDSPGESGHLLLSEAAFEEKVRAFMSRGFQVAVHAIGDRANTVALQTLGRVAEELGKQDGRHRIEHAQILRAGDLPLFKRHRIIASMQPTHATSDMNWVESRLGEQRVKGAYAWRQLLDAGATLTLGSDFPVESPDVLQGLYAARTRQDANGKPDTGFFPKERLTAREALEGFTTGPAWASFAETQRGRLAVGMDADFVSLTKDPLKDAAPTLREAKVETVVVAGRP